MKMKMKMKVVVVVVVGVDDGEAMRGKDSREWRKFTE